MLQAESLGIKDSKQDLKTFKDSSVLEKLVSSYETQYGELCPLASTLEVAMSS